VAGAAPVTVAAQTTVFIITAVSNLAVDVQAVIDNNLAVSEMRDVQLTEFPLI